LGSVAIVGVDNNPGRIAASRFYWKQGVPVIFTAVSREADHGYVFIQKPGEACFGCLSPQAVNDETYPCSDRPAVKDILKVVAGIVVYAVDTLLMRRLDAGTTNPSILMGQSPAWIAILPGARIARRKPAIKPLILSKGTERLIRAINFYRFMGALDCAHLLYSPSSLTYVRSLLSSLSRGEDFKTAQYLYRFPLPNTSSGNTIKTYTLARSSLRFFLYLFDYSGKGGTMWCIVYPWL
jgi:hypothetical protein